MLALTYVVGASDHLYNHELEAGWASIEEGMHHAEDPRPHRLPRLRAAVGSRSGDGP